MTIRLEVVSENYADLINELSGLLRGNVRITMPAVTVAQTDASKATVTVNGAPAQPEPTPLEAAIAAAPEGRSDLDEIKAKVDASKATFITPKGRGRPRKAQTSEAPAGALTGGLSPSVPASQPAVENTGSDSLPLSPSVGDVAVESPVAAAPVAATVGADAKTMRNALQDLSARIGGNDGLDAVAEVIGKFGFTKVSQITPDQHDAIIAAAAAYQKD